MSVEKLSGLYSEEQLGFCEELPKVELHAHLNGSIRDFTIRELAEKHAVDPELIKLTSKGERGLGQRTLAECFRLFDVIHQVVTDHATVTRITEEVVEDFAEDCVVYLELRTTPKDRPEHGMTKRSYVEAVLEGIKRYEETVCQAQDARQITVRLLLSIDRREDAAAAAETVRLAGELQARGVVGVDLSGNPAVGDWRSWEPALAHARELGLKLTLHAGEVYNPGETAAMLDFRPDRLGHMCCLDEALEKSLQESRIPLELCLSSNVITESVKGYPDHHFLPLFQSGHPVILCTDDSGIFSTRLSREYAIAAAAFRLEPVALLTLAEAAIEHAFLDAAGKEALRSRFEGFRIGHPGVGASRLRHVPLEPVLDSLHLYPGEAAAASGAV